MENKNSFINKNIEEFISDIPKNNNSSLNSNFGFNQNMLLKNSDNLNLTLDNKDNESNAFKYYSQSSIGILNFSYWMI